MEKIENVQIKWWKIKSFWKLVACGAGAILGSLLSVFIVPNAWCLIGVITSCCIGGFFMRKIFPEVLKHLL
jgi:hypothetical protein